MNAYRVAVTDTAQGFLTVGSRSATIKNAGTSSIYLGGSGVSSTTGYELEAGDSLDTSRLRGEIFAICATSETSTLHVLTGAGA